LKRAAIVAIAIAGVACGPPAEGPKAKTATAPALIAVEATRWLPADEGTVYAYKTSDLVSGTTGVLMLRTRRISPTNVDLVGPRHTEHLEYRENGIVRMAEGTYLLRTPLTEGATWPGGPNASFRVGKVGTTVKLAAGEFDRCAEVVEQRTGAVRGTVTTVFCADVGIVSIETEGGSADGAAKVHERAELTSYGKAVDIGAPGVTKTQVKLARRGNAPPRSRVALSPQASGPRAEHAASLTQRDRQPAEVADAGVEAVGRGDQRALVELARRAEEAATQLVADLEIEAERGASEVGGPIGEREVVRVEAREHVAGRELPVENGLRDPFAGDRIDPRGLADQQRARRRVGLVRIEPTLGVPLLLAPREIEPEPLEPRR
jgi:hypothetical protein